MSDPTEHLRKERIVSIQDSDNSRQALQSRVGQTWNTSELQENFEALGFLAPYIVVRRKVDQIKGSMEFCISDGERVYHSFEPE